MRVSLFEAMSGVCGAVYGFSLSSSRILFCPCRIIQRVGVLLVTLVRVAPPILHSYIGHGNSLRACSFFVISLSLCLAFNISLIHPYDSIRIDRIIGLDELSTNALSLPPSLHSSDPTALIVASGTIDKKARASLPFLLPSLRTALNSNFFSLAQVPKGLKSPKRRHQNRKSYLSLSFAHGKSTSCRYPIPPAFFCYLNPFPLSLFRVLSPLVRVCLCARMCMLVLEILPHTSLFGVYSDLSTRVSLPSMIIS